MSYNEPGNILISDQYNNRVIEVTPRGDIVWFFGLGPTDFSANSIIGVNNAERVGKYTLMAGTGTGGGSPAGLTPVIPPNIQDNRVMIVDKKKNIVWQYGQFGLTGSGPNLLSSPVDCIYVPHRHKKDGCGKCRDKSGDHSGECETITCSHHKLKLNGTILITDQGNNRVIEVNQKKCIVWQYPGSNTNPSDQLDSPNSAQKLCNGHVLIADENNNRAIEVNHCDKVVRVFTAGGTLGACAYASRLPNGNTLLTDAGNSRIVEVDDCDRIVWQYVANGDNQMTPSSPSRGLRLKDGRTIISDQFDNRVIIVSTTNVVSSYYGLPLITDLPADTPNPNNGYDTRTTQLGLYGPYDAKVIGDYTGLTDPCQK